VPFFEIALSAKRINRFVSEMKMVQRKLLSMKAA